MAGILLSVRTDTDPSYKTETLNFLMSQTNIRVQVIDIYSSTFLHFRKLSLDPFSLVTEDLSIALPENKDFE